MAKILVTDDAAFMRMIVKNALAPLGHTIVEAVNGQDMLDKYKAEQPDVVTLDITMPEMDGLTALKELMKIDKNAKVIMCTAMGQQTMVMDAIQYGAKDFIVKPFENDKVLASVQKLLG